MTTSTYEIRHENDQINELAWQTGSIWAVNNWVQHSYVRYVVNLNEDIDTAESLLIQSEASKYEYIGLQERIIIKDRCPLA
jgi:hypothetical protein